TEAGAGACDARGVGRLYAFDDPAGNPVELCLGHRDEAAPQFPRPLGGFKTGDCGLGHMVYAAHQIAPLVEFYTSVLGFRISDSAEEPFTAAFLHVNPRHHSLAFVEAGRTGVHHVMVELYAFDDVGQAYDRAELEEGRVAVTLGRHTNDFMTSFYAATPSGFMIEYGWGGRMIDPDHWRAEVLHDGPSLWGHERKWLQGPKRQLARDMRLRAAEAGRKAPMQVSEGFFDIAERAAAPVRSKA
ncbi:MAG: VOC family protein, partial [Caulobacteraceae bacterium]